MLKVASIVTPEDRCKKKSNYLKLQGWVDEAHS
jgi:hypothetical protein